MEPIVAADSAETTSTKDPFRSLRWAVRAAWSFGVLAVALLWAQSLAMTLHPWGWTFAVLAATAIAATIACVFIGTWRAIFGPRRQAALGWMVLGLLPAAVVSGAIVAGMRQYQRSQIAPTAPFVMFAMAASSLGEIEAPFRYARVESDHLVMFHDARVTDPNGDLAAMEKHVANLERMTRRRLRAKIHWVRGPLLGQRFLSIAGFALGSDVSPAGHEDRHELAHAVIFQSRTPTTDSPMLLNEGWAESQSRDPISLAHGAIAAHRHLLALSRMPVADARKVIDALDDPEGYARIVDRTRLVFPAPLPLIREMTEPYWYHRDRGPVYGLGGAFSDFLVRTHGAEKFVSFFLAARPGSIDEACHAVYEKRLDALEAEFWREAERMTRGR